MSATLELRGITKRYGAVLANDGIDLDVAPGEVVGLLGENGSGKSTLMKAVFGMVTPDSGSIRIGQQPLAGHTPSVAMAAGIGMVHQHFMLFDSMTVTENVLLGLPGGGIVRPGRAGAAIRRTSRAYGLDLEPHAVVGTLSLGARQRVEIVKALMRGARLLILDEPTSNLAPGEVEQLLGVCARLREDGKSVVFISHKLGEVLAICDRIVVLRDGRVVARQPTGTASRADLARLMVGRDPVPIASVDRRPRAPSPATPLLTLQDVRLAFGSGEQAGEMSLTIRAGEIVALAGVDGNGQTELAETIAGLRRPKGGTIRLGTQDVTRRGVAARLRAGLAFIPADRASTSLVPRLSVADNLMLRDFRGLPFARRGWLRPASLRRAAALAIGTYRIRTPGSAIAAGRLSGGNQQKIVLARELSRAPLVLVALQASWGLDPEATGFVLEQMRRLRESGAAILYISSELEEVLALGDRVGVMAGGRLVEVMPRSEADAGRLGLLMGSSGRPE